MADQVYNNNAERNDNNSNKPEEAKSLDASKEGIALFFGQAEQELFLSLGKEITQEFLRESFLLYRIDLKTTKVHDVYGESKQKNYLPPVQIYGRINVESTSPEYIAGVGLIRQGLGTFTANVYLKHLEELQAQIRMGDFVYHKENMYEIIDDGSGNISNQYAFGGDKYFYITIKGREVNSDVFSAR